MGGIGEEALGFFGVRFSVVRVFSYMAREILI